MVEDIMTVAWKLELEVKFIEEYQEELTTEGIFWSGNMIKLKDKFLTNNRIYPINQSLYDCYHQGHAGHMDKDSAVYQHSLSKLN